MCGQCTFQGPDTWAEIEKRKRPDGYNLWRVFFLSFLSFVFWPSPLITTGTCCARWVVIYRYFELYDTHIHAHTHACTEKNPLVLQRKALKSYCLMFSLSRVEFVNVCCTIKTKDC